MIDVQIRFESGLLRTFVAVVDTGSFSKAADKIGRTQSAVSMQIKQLETMAGTPLLVRGNGPVTVSPSGEKLLQDARPILAHLERAEANFSSGALSGSVRIGLLAEYGATYLPDILGHFAETHPKVEVAVTCAHSGRLYQLLEKDELDLAIVLDQPDRKGGTVLMCDPTFWATSKAHLVHERPVLPVAVFGPGCWWRDWALESLAQMDRAYHIAYTSDNNFNLKGAVSGGLAVGLLTKSMLPDDCRPLLRDEGFPAPISSNVTLRTRNGSASKAVKAMAKVIVAEFR
ncbi:MAG: LysR family transcriptional regulator [Hyphomicrobiaceae bacterium]|nr:LysR family transcriptional regulator [Hyphomicrobiaceae bacterium]